MMFQSLFAKFAAAGLAGKAAAGGAAVLVAASAGGAADALPSPAQDAFDRLVATETVEDVHDDAIEDVEDDGSFGARVAEDARDGGVDGAQIACEASQGRSGLCEEAPADADAQDEDENDTMEGFGTEVAEDAQDGGVDGQEVSQSARERNPGVAGASDAQD